VKKKIGYLPEIPPLYTSMVVRDYVAFAARIKGAADPEGAAKLAMGKVGLDEVAHRLIDHLSKGYRQRVGLAQALVHDPEVLVLDEPTSGLDPAQRVEIRDLLKSLAAGDRTVILSTHVPVRGGGRLRSRRDRQPGFGGRAGHDRGARVVGSAHPTQGRPPGA
jgi:ABC-2 type transport system ATP-binding protein